MHGSCCVDDAGVAHDDWAHVNDELMVDGDGPGGAAGDGAGAPVADGCTLGTLEQPNMQFWLADRLARIGRVSPTVEMLVDLV